MGPLRHFPYASPYPDQANAIDTSLSVARDGGFFTMEAACGTGKTISSLTVGVTLLRDLDTHIHRVVAATPIKNQLEQFVTETRVINEEIPENESPVRGITLIGKADLHPYLREGTLDAIDGNDDLSDLRDRAATLVKRGSEVTLRNESSIEEDEFWRETWFNPERARLVKQLVTQQVEAIQVRDGPDSETVRTELNTLETGGVETPYPVNPPLVEDVVAEPEDLEDEDRGPFDPFFIGVLAADHLPFGFSDAPNHVVTKAELLEGAAGQGICPYEAMGVFAKNAHIIICNYNHVFDYRTRLLTDKKLKLLNLETFLIIDEAHALEGRARELFSESLGRQTLSTARNDLRGAIQLSSAGQIITLDQDDPEHPPAAQLSVGEKRRREMALEILMDHNLDREQLQVLRDVFTEINSNFIDDIVKTNLSAIDENLEDVIRTGEVPKDAPEPISLEPSDDEFEANDILTNALIAGLKDRCEDLHFGAEAIVENLTTIGRAVVEIWQQTSERDEQIQYVTHFIDKWIPAGDSTYYRELDLEYSPTGDSDDWVEWDDIYNATLELHNCIPADELAAIFNEFGGGVCMSATLEPHDVFQDVNGLDILHKKGNRTIETATYGIQFPTNNRASLIAPLSPFTYSNRKEPTIDFNEMTATRENYANQILGIAGTHGNILIGMPSYAEAEWAHDLLVQDDYVRKEVLLDEPSQYEDTQSLLDRFWKEDDQYRILTTSLRGTVTEGVDYAGNKLHTAVIVGVPIINTKEPRMQAVKDAYCDRYGDNNAFDYTFTIPAVRKARQAIGRVIRSHTDVGLRLFIDERYSTDSYNSVFRYLSDWEQTEFSVVANPVESIKMFWETQRSNVVS